MIDSLQNETQAINPEIKRVALNHLARRDYSAEEIKQKLLTKAYAAHDVEQVIAVLISKDLLNDVRLTENYIHKRRAQGYGPKKILFELNARGISTDISNELVDLKDPNWFLEIKKLWQKHFKGNKPKAYKDRAKQIRYFQLRGYAQSHIDTLFEK